jgi:hypothetical protein
MLPAGYEPVIMPSNFSWQAPEAAGTIKVVVRYSPQANTIRMIETAELKPAVIPAYKFPEIMKASRVLAHPDMRTILLKKAGRRNNKATPAQRPHTTDLTRPIR